MSGAGSRMTNLFDENPHSATVRYRADILFLRLARSVWAWARCPDSTRQPSMRPSSPTSQVINRILSQRWVMVTPQRFILVRHEIGSAHDCTPVTNAHLVCRLLLEQKT